MASGKSLTLDGLSFNNALLKYLRDDVVLPKQGAMMLIDPTHPAGAWAAGVPANLATVPNIAASQLSTLLASSADADIQAKMYSPATFTGAAGKIERTSKGGLHGISSMTSSVQLSGPVVAFSTKLVKYVLDNPTHDYYMSMWARVTREPLTGFNNSSLFAFNGNAQQTNSYLFNVAAAHVGNLSGGTYPYSVRPPATPTGLRLGIHEDGHQTLLGNKFISMATDRWFTNTTGLESSRPGDGTNTTVTGAFAAAGLPFGSTIDWPGIGATGTTGTAIANPSSASANLNKADSHIIYRLYMEDLTVSGRTFTEVDAISYAEYTKQVLTVGGRYYGDTFTDPATIP